MAKHAKKNLKKQRIVKTVLVVLIIGIVLFLFFDMRTKNKIKSLGYTSEQIKTMYELKFDINVILNNEYCSNIDRVLNKDFDKSTLDAFLKECSKVQEETPVEPEEPETPEEPEEPEGPEIPEEPKEPEIITPLATKEKILNQKYYIPDRLERYINYASKNPSKDAKAVVTEVNCNIDYEFYTNTRPADLSKGYLLLVNKYYYVDSSYTPIEAQLLEKNKYTYWDNAKLAKVAYDAYVQMLDDAKEQGYNIIDTSPYRSYSYQGELYNNYVASWGKAQADRSSARPGHSEHQTGLASDTVKNGVSMYDFGSTKEFKWMQENAHKYGFFLRYPEGKEYLTGYKYEPWHYRYVGVDVATYIHENNIVYEEYYAYFCEYKNEC